MNNFSNKTQKFKSLSNFNIKYIFNKKLFILPLNYWDSNFTIPLKEISNHLDENNNNVINNDNHNSTEIDHNNIFYTIPENKPSLTMIHPNWNIYKGDYVIKSRDNKKKIITKSEFRILFANSWILLIIGLITIVLLSIIKDF